MSADIPETQEEKAKALVKCVKTLGQLLGAIRESDIAQAFTESSDGEALNRYLKRRGEWSALFREIGEDVAKQAVVYRQQIHEAQQLVRLSRDAVAVFNSPEFEQGIQKLEQFIGLFERLERIKQSGLLGDVLNSIRAV